MQLGDHKGKRASLNSLQAPFMPGKQGRRPKRTTVKRPRVLTHERTNEQGPFTRAQGSVLKQECHFSSHPARHVHTPKITDTKQAAGGKKNTEGKAGLGDAGLERQPGRHGDKVHTVGKRVEVGEGTRAGAPLEKPGPHSL